MESHDYYARINGKDYPIAWGFQIMEEMGETLDSGSITIPHLFEIVSMKPYDDVIIHDYLPNASPEEGGLPNRPLGKVFSAGEGHFYKHMVVASYTREKVNLTDEREKVDDSGKKYFSRVYNYRIQLKSETCKLETVQLPNKTITQPMSVADGTDSETISANFKFGGDTKKYTLPYGIENSSAGKSFRLVELIVEATPTAPSSQYTVLHAYINDENAATADYSSFLTMKGSVSSGEAVVLPDWAISGVTTAKEDYSEGAITKHRYYDDWYPAITHHPKKHWIIRKLSGKSNKGWESRSVVISRIKAYLAGAADSEIVNDKLTGKEGATLGIDITDADGNVTGKDISSSEPVSSILAVFPSEEASYIVYLYCEPEIVGFFITHYANLYGMTDNSNGATKPTEEDEFLCSWGTESEPFSVSDGTMTSKGALSAYEAMRQAVELYSPYLKSKESADSDKWAYRRKFSIGDDVKAIFSSVTAPENQWNCPNLRDFLTRIMYVKDCIPVVHDNVINCMSLSKRGVIPFDDSKGLFGIENYAMDGNSYCDRLIRTYSDGLSKDNVVKCVERVGFRNSSSATLTLDSLRLELAHPIYRITKIMMCHYNTMTATTSSGKVSTYSGVIKHDITPLVLMNSQRNLLSEDWASLNATTPKSIKELAKYKYATVGYDVGSRYITGWGAKYTYPSCVFWSGTKTTIENIFTFAYNLAPYGSNAFSLLKKLQNLAGSGGTADRGAGFFPTGADGERKAIYSKDFPDSADSTVAPSDTLASDYAAVDLGTYSYGGIFSNLTQKMKSLFFIVEYEGYVSASVMASKDFHDGDVVSRDNASSSLSFVESDGANQKEKVNRLGNAIVTQPVRYSSRDDIEELAQVWDGYSLSDDEREQGEDVSTSGRAKEHDDEVLYQRKMVFERDFIQASYTFCRNYVLRNYFTSVFGKRRPFALASYEESVERQENRTIQLRFSPDSAYYQPESMSKVANYSESTLIPTILSFYKATEYDDDGEKIIANGIDSCYYIVFPSKNFVYDGQCGVFATDCQKFTSGNSACFSVSMQDNASAGVFVSDWNPTFGTYIGNLLKSRVAAITTWNNSYNLTEEDVKATNLLTGSKQSWLKFPVDPDTGELYSMRFGVGFRDGDFYAIDTPRSMLNNDDVADYQLLPLLDAAVGSVDKSIFTWFGKVEDGVGHGHGSPRMAFERNSSLYAENGLAYRVDFANSSSAHTYDEWVHEWTASQYFSMFFGDAKTYRRPEIQEFLSAKFVGRETENSEETDTCVFKDGKERISVTMQVEPVSEDNRVLFSDRMMKLSDAIGGHDKNYDEVDLGKDFKAIVGMTTRRFYYYYYASGSPVILMKSYLTACLPSVSILVPEGASTSGVEVNESFVWAGSGTFYYIDVYRIKGKDANGNLLVECGIGTMTGIVDETVVFHKDDESSYISGRTGSSKFAKDWTLFLSSVESGYSAYSMVEDGFLESKSSSSGVSGLVTFDDEAYVNKTSPSTKNPYGTESVSGSLIAVGYDSYPSAPLNANSHYCSAEETMAYERSESYGTDETWRPVPYSKVEKSPMAIASADIDGSVKPRNMYWVKAPLMGSRETSWDVRDSLEDSEFDVMEGLLQETTEARSEDVDVDMTIKKGTSRFNSSTQTISSFDLDSEFPPEIYEVESYGFELSSYDTHGVAVSNLYMIGRLNDLTRKFEYTLTGGIQLVAVKDITITVSCRIAVTLHLKRRLPISAEKDSRGLWRLKIALDEPLTGDRSIRLYYKEGREYHFVFGTNLGAKADEGKSNDVIYPSNDKGNVYYIYVSALDDRSKTVIDAATGDPSYKVVDWLDGDHKDAEPYNACVKKSQ